MNVESDQVSVISSSIEITVTPTIKKSKLQEVLYAWLCTKVYIPNHQESIVLVHQLAK